MKTCDVLDLTKGRKEGCLFSKSSSSGISVWKE